MTDMGAVLPEHSVLGLLPNLFIHKGIFLLSKAFEFTCTFGPH